MLALFIVNFIHGLFDFAAKIFNGAGLHLAVCEINIKTVNVFQSPFRAALTPN